MRPRISILLLFCVACSPGAEGPGTELADVTPGFQAPVLTNAEIPVVYPADLFEAGVEGTVILRLVIDELGELVHDSTTVAESSGEPRLDEAAVDGTELMQFAPALRDGDPVATVFLQPVHFRQSDNPNPAEQ